MSLSLRDQLLKAGLVNEKQIAQLLGNGLRIVLAHRLQHFAEFLAHLVHYRQRLGPVETDLGGAFLQFGGTTECRQCARHVIEQRQLFRSSGFLGTLLGLDLFPALLDGRLVETRQLRRTIQVTIREHVGMATDQLAGDGIDHRGELEAPFLTGQLAVVDDLKQQVAQLTGQMIEVAALDSIRDLVSLFQRMRHDARVVLLQIPGAAMLRIAQAGHQVQEVVELVHGIPQRIEGG